MEKTVVCDCHAHVFDPKRFPYAHPRRFTPGVATAQQLQARMAALGIDRVVLVQPSVYGEDNTCLVDALKVFGKKARGVAVVSTATPKETFATLQKAGVVGARLNLVVEHLEDPQIALHKLTHIEQAIPADWHVQLHVSTEMLGHLAEHIRQSQRTYVLDHIGLPAVGQGVESPNWQTLLTLVQEKHLYVKLSAPYLTSRVPAPHRDLKTFLASLLSTRANHILWGSNWPHTQGTSRSIDTPLETVEEFRKVDDAAWLTFCSTVAASNIRLLTSTNAEKLYGFDN
jgi:2-pyrone-4,6-dicarboxylate lactonase